MSVDSIRANLEKTRSFWQRWIALCTYDGRWQEAVRRSAITLKLLTYAPSGAIVAAPTTSLPEWIGNGAFDQRQLDVYGGVVAAAYLYERHGHLLTPEQWTMLRREIDYVCVHWDEPDHGIWEIRGANEHHTFSKLMCWVTLDRGIRLTENEGWTYATQLRTDTRAAICTSIFEQGGNEAIGAFTQSYGSTTVDASLLTLPLMGFLPPTDPRIHATIARINEQLGDGALVYRYPAHDHLPEGEGAFLLYSFWMVDALVMTGHVDEAVRRFEALLSYSNLHGLFSEEVDPATGSALGNYPQAFSHIGLINSALDLTHATGHLHTSPAPGTA